MTEPQNAIANAIIENCVQKPLEEIQTEPIDIAADTMLGDLIQTMRQELHALPDVWSKLSEDRQLATLERIESSCRFAIGQCVRIIASDNRPTVSAKLESITVKDGFKAVLKLAPGTPEAHALIDAAGTRVLLLLAPDEKYAGGAAEAIRPDPAQGSLELQTSKSDEQAAEELQTRLRAALCGTIPVSVILSWVADQRDQARAWAEGFVAHLNNRDDDSAGEAIPQWLAGVVEDINVPRELYSITDNSGAGDLATGVWAKSPTAAADYYRAELKLTDDTEVSVRKPKKSERKGLSVMNPQDEPKDA